MLITGIIGQDCKMQTANLINFILSASGKKVSIFDIKNFANTDHIEDYLSELQKKNVDILICRISANHDLKNIIGYMNFDVMICEDKADDIKEIGIWNYTTMIKDVFSLLSGKGTFIVNVDNIELIKMLYGKGLYTVTYGFNPKASITTSSVGDDLSQENFMCCLQRSISTRIGNIIEPQEYRINIYSQELDPYNILAAASFAIVNDVDLNALEMINPVLAL